MERMKAPPPVSDLDWPAERARELGRAVTELWAELLERIDDLPVSRPRTVDGVRSAVAVPLPDEPWPVDRLVEYLREIAFEQSTLTGHPGFMAFISGAGTVPGAAADLLAAALNQNVGGWRLAPAATEIELSLTRWFAARLGLPEGSGGLITSGGAMSAFVGLKAARDAKAGWDIRHQGVAAGPPLTLYASAEAHVVNARAADMLGLGADAVRLIPTDARLRMRVDLLREAIAADLAEGRRPFAVVATAGTTGTGAIDPLDEIADVCAEHDLWFHVDGAYGGIAAMVDALRPRFRGIERADSVVLDPHKWLYTPHSGGALVVRDLRDLADAFTVDPSYTREDKALTGNGLDLFTLGPQFSRGFHALKIWISLLAHGWSAYERRIVHDTELVRYLHERVAATDDLEPVTPPSLSIATFRYVPTELRGDAGATPYLNRLNERLMVALQQGGRVYPSNAVVDGTYALRVCIVNYRTEADDMDALVEEAVRHGRRLHRELRGVEGVGVG